MTLLALSLWFVHPAPLDMPRAEAYFVQEEGELWLEDRFSTADLWTSQSVLGRWEDDDGRRFTVARLDLVPPAFAEPPCTRTRYAAARVVYDRRDKSADGLRVRAVARLAPFAPAEEPSAPFQQIRGLDEVLYYHGTNRAAVVCAFLPAASPAWYAAVWELLPEDDFDRARARFEAEFLGKWREVVETVLVSERGRADDDAASVRRARRPRRPPPEGRAAERELLRADAAHSVANYANWHVTDAPEFCVLDDLPPDNAFVRALTNELPVLRAKYAAAVPTPVDGTNVLAVARIFKDRDEYLDAAGEGMAWTAAYWSQQRREIVAYLPLAGADALMKTIRHEAFHQYLSYACAMIPASPWLNEGYAEYFEDEDAVDWGLGRQMPALDDLAASLPDLLDMDYAAFYAGSPSARRLKYRLAWSVAVFLEKGAPGVPFDPFRDVKKNYVAALLRHKDMRRATAEAFGTDDDLAHFIAEWKKFWQNM